MGRAALHLVPLVEQVHGRLVPGRTMAAPPVVEFYPYVDTRSTIVVRGRRFVLRLSDHLQDADPQVLEGLVGILLCRLLGVPESRVDPAARRAYRAHVDSADVASRRNASRRRRGRKVLDPVGRHRSLLESYLRVAFDMDLTLTDPPRLGWSPTASRSRFGHWDEAHRCIVISRILDDPRIPEFVLDSVVHHEMLHVIHPVRLGRGRRRIHTPEFVAAERRFPRWKEADAWLRRLAGRSWRPPDDARRPRARKA